MLVSMGLQAAHLGAGGLSSGCGTLLLAYWFSMSCHREHCRAQPQTVPMQGGVLGPVRRN